MRDLAPHQWECDLFTRLYGLPIYLVLPFRQLISCIFAVTTVWCVGAGGASLGWKLPILDEDVKLRPVTEPILVQARPKFGLILFRSVVNEDGDVVAQELELFSSSPVWWSHVR